MPRYQKPPTEIWQGLVEQVEALRASAKGFDSGYLWEAKRLAAIVHVLVHDGGKRTTSILTQLGLRNGLRFLGSAPPFNPNNLLTEMSLVMMRISDTGASYIPILGSGPFPPRELDFSSWWEEPILRDTNRRIITRKNLVFSLRDQDGGAHFDPTLDNEAYTSISRGGGAGWRFGRIDGPGNDIAPGPHLASMRQIAYEVEQTISSIDRLRAPK